MKKARVVGERSGDGRALYARLRSCHHSHTRSSLNPVPSTMIEATSRVAKASILARVSEAEAVHEGKTMCVR